MFQVRWVYTDCLPAGETCADLSQPGTSISVAALVYSIDIALIIMLDIMINLYEYWDMR